MGKAVVVVDELGCVDVDAVVVVGSVVVLVDGLVVFVVVVVGDVDVDVLEVVGAVIG